jgi:hypothetical protein
MIDKRYLRLTVLPAREQLSTHGCFSRGGGGAGGAGHQPGIKQEGPATTRQFPCGMGLYSVIGGCHASSTDKNVGPGPLWPPGQSMLTRISWATPIRFAPIDLMSGARGIPTNGRPIQRCRWSHPAHPSCWQQPHLGRAPGFKRRAAHAWKLYVNSSTRGLA